MNPNRALTNPKQTWKICLDMNCLGSDFWEQMRKITTFYVVGPKGRWCMKTFILHLGTLELEVLIFTRTKDCLPAHVKTKWTRTLQPRSRAQQRHDLPFLQGHGSSSSGFTEEDNINFCIISQLLGMPITFRVVLECGFLEGTINTFLHAKRIWAMKRNGWHLYWQFSNVCCCPSPWTEGLLMANGLTLQVSCYRFTKKIQPGTV